MRFYLGTCEYKWTHADSSMEHIWIRRELGDDLYLTVEKNGWDWILLRSNSQTLPGDIYCRCDIYVDAPDDKNETLLFSLKYQKAQFVNYAHNK